MKALQIPATALLAALSASCAAGSNQLVRADMEGQRQLVVRETAPPSDADRRNLRLQRRKRAGDPDPAPALQTRKARPGRGEERLSPQQRRRMERAEKAAMRASLRSAKPPGKAPYPGVQPTLSLFDQRLDQHYPGYRQGRQAVPVHSGVLLVLPGLKNPSPKEEQPAHEHKDFRKTPHPADTKVKTPLAAKKKKKWIFPPKDTPLRFAACSANQEVQPPAAVRTLTPKRGDTWWLYGTTYNTSYREMAHLNGFPLEEVKQGRMLTEGEPVKVADNQGRPPGITFCKKTQELGQRAEPRTQFQGNRAPWWWRAIAPAEWQGATSIQLFPPRRRTHERTQMGPPPGMADPNATRGRKRQGSAPRNL